MDINSFENLKVNIVALRQEQAKLNAEKAVLAEQVAELVKELKANGVSSAEEAKELLQSLTKELVLLEAEAKSVIDRLQRESFAKVPLVKKESAKLIQKSSHQQNEAEVTTLLEDVLMDEL